MMLSLADMTEGCVVTVADISRIQEVVRRRLLDLGVLEGSRIRVARCLPFGGPLMIECDGQCIGLRRCEAPLIQVIREC